MAAAEGSQHVVDMTAGKGCTEWHTMADDASEYLVADSTDGKPRLKKL